MLRYIWNEATRGSKNALRAVERFIREWQRPLILLGVGCGEYAAVVFGRDWLKANVVEPFTDIGLNQAAVATILLGSIPAFVLWLWRERNKQADIRNAEAARTLSDFHKVQEWAAEREKPDLQTTAAQRLIAYAADTEGAYREQAAQTLRGLLAVWSEKLDEFESDDIEEGSPPAQLAPGFIRIIHKGMRENGLGFPTEFWFGLQAPGAYLFRANLNNAKLSHANLKNANLFLANLNNAELIGAELNGANLAGARLGRANLAGAILTGAILARAELGGADLDGTDLVEAMVTVDVVDSRPDIDWQARGAHLVERDDKAKVWRVIPWPEDS